MSITGSRHGLPCCLAGAVLALACLPARGGERLIHGFEDTQGLTTSGGVKSVQGADAVTEGAKALQLAPGSRVSVTIPPQAIAQAGWLKVDTFEVQPVLACLRVTLTGAFSRPGYVRPGKDTLALPLGLGGRIQRGLWPAAATRLELHNAGSEPVVVDNVRLVEPAPAPAGAVLLDLGPPGQDLWCGFEHAESEGTGIAWSANVYSHAVPYPDPLLGDFVGAYLAPRARDTLTVESKAGPGVGYAWVTHYGTLYSPALEYVVALNGRSLLHKAIAPTAMLSPEGLLQGKDQPWTPEWFEQSFVPAIVSRVELALNSGSNSLELANCQVAALALAPREQQQALRDYIRALDDDLARFRRQFVLARQDRPRCQVVPTDEETQAGAMFFAPPAEEWFNRVYAPRSEDRAGVLRCVAAAGSTATIALAVVPCEDAPSLQLVAEPLRGPAGGTIAPGSIKVQAVETVPVVSGACVYYQPFLPTRSFRTVKARGVHWFCLQVSVPDRAHAGVYQGALRPLPGKPSARLPVEVEVCALAAAGPEEETPTFGVFSEADPYDVYRSLAAVLPAPQQAQVTREIFSTLFSFGLNAGVIPGPGFAGIPTPSVTEMLIALRAYPRPARPGRTLVNLRRGISTLGSAAVRPGTPLYATAVQNLARASTELATKGGLTNHALYVDNVYNAADMPDATRLAKLVRSAGGRPAIVTRTSLLAGMPAGERGDLLGALDALICTPDQKGLGGIRDEFKKGGEKKTFALEVGGPDVYAWGFYAWGVGGDGAYAPQIFSALPLFNPFWFDGRTLLVPTPDGKFEPSLAMVQVGAGMDDYALARRCEALVKLARPRRIDTQDLEKVLTEIHVAADGTVPGFDVARWRSGGVPPARLVEWRTALARAAGKISEELKR